MKLREEEMDTAGVGGYKENEEARGECLHEKINKERQAKNTHTLK